MLVVLTAVFITVSSLVAALPLPNYIKACSKTDPNFEECSLHSAQNALPILAKGDKKYGVISILPLVIPELTLRSQNMVLSFKDLHIYGIENSTFKEFEWNEKELRSKFVTTVERILYVGDYEIDGHIMIFPIKGSGKAQIEFFGGTYTYNMGIEMTTRNGVQYVRLVNTKCDYTVSRIHYQLDNLFNGDERIGAELSKVLNENWEVVDKDFHSVIAKTNGEICTNIANAIVSKVPYRELALD